MYVLRSCLRVQLGAYCYCKEFYTKLNEILLEKQVGLGNISVIVVKDNNAVGNIAAVTFTFSWHILDRDFNCRFDETTILVLTRPPKILPLRFVSPP